jgi:hypothetical protein
MRLGQLARKLDKRPIDIVDFLAKKDITIEENANTKVEDAHVALVFQHFAPSASIGEAPTADIPSSTDTVVSNAEKVSDVGADYGSVVQEADNLETEAEIPEVIKAPKVALSGLKIIGKIELPEPKPKLAEGTIESTVAPDAEPKAVSKEPRKEKRNANFSRPQRSSSNPIALQREREALEAKSKREEEIQRQKERRTQNYLKKVKGPQPTKAVRFVKEETEQMSAAELAEAPKTWWGKFIKWLTT